MQLDVMIEPLVGQQAPVAHRIQRKALMLKLPMGSELFQGGPTLSGRRMHLRCRAAAFCLYNCTCSTAAAARWHCQQQGALPVEDACVGHVPDADWIAPPWADHLHSAKQGNARRLPKQALTLPVPCCCPPR